MTYLVAIKALAQSDISMLILQLPAINDRIYSVNNAIAKFAINFPKRTNCKAPGMTSACLESLEWLLF